MDTERHLVAHIARSLSSARKTHGLRLGIGDDAAILQPTLGKQYIVTCDSFLEGVHFFGQSSSHPSPTPPDSVGYKSLARAASDLAAMGATPRFFLMSLALPGRLTGRWLDAMLAGMRRAARQLGLHIAGGDTTRNPQIMLSLTVIGEIVPNRALTRSGARPGDLIYVSGPLGRAQLGLELLRRGLDKKPSLRPLLRHHLYPRIPIKLGQWLAARRIPSAAMDISDGLSTDLGRLCAASGVGARLWSPCIPQVKIPPSLPPGKSGRLDALSMALHGGDDYELLFTLPRRRAHLLRRAPGFRSCAQIGEITRARSVALISAIGSAIPLDPLGWDSFRR